MSANGKGRSRRPRIEMISPVADDAEAAAIVAAVEQFLADTAPPPAEEKPRDGGWQAAALREGVAAKQLTGGQWGHAPSWGDRS